MGIYYPSLLKARRENADCTEPVISVCDREA